MSACSSLFGRICDKCSGRDSIDDEDWRRRSRGVGRGQRSTQRRTVMGEIRPPNREQVEFHRLCAAGGPLLRLQVCLCARGAEATDWFIGRLFVAEAGILVESTDDLMFVTPLLRWDEIKELTDTHIGKTRKYEVLVLTDKFALRIVLGSQFNMEWLQATYTASTGESEGWFSFGSAYSDDEYSGSVAKTLSQKVTMNTTWYPGDPSFDRTDDYLQDIVVPQLKTFHDSMMPNTTIEEIKTVLEREEWPFVELLHDKMKCWDITMAPWKESMNIPNSQIRCAQYSMTLPKAKGVPPALASLVGVPDSAVCISNYRIIFNRNEVFVLMKSGSKGVKHGDNMCIQVTMRWRQQENDVIFTEYLQLVWETRLAFYALAAKPFIEGQAKADALALAKQLCDIIKTDVGKLKASAMSAGTGMAPSE